MAATAHAIKETRADSIPPGPSLGVRRPRWLGPHRRDHHRHRRGHDGAGVRARGGVGEDPVRHLRRGAGHGITTGGPCLHGERRADRHRHGDGVGRHGDGELHAARQHAAPGSCRERGGELHRPSGHQRHAHAGPGAPQRGETRAAGASRRVRPCSPSCAPGRPCTSSWGSRRNGASVRCRVCAGSGAPPSRTRPARASGVASRRRWCLRSREGHAPVPRSLMSDPLVRGTTHAVVTPGLLAVARPLKASRPPFHTPLLTRRPRHRGSGDVPRRSVAHDPVPRRGVRRGVRHLRVLLPGTGVLREGLSRVRTTAAMPGRQRATSAQRGRPARSS